ncbi:MAG: hypothetical protein KBT21_08595 [Treponema sp.]|nr:hypothetical protein [Candidatus Treponema merdequi]
MIKPFKFVIYGETPAKKNREWHDKAVQQLALQWDLDSEPIETKTAITLHFFHGDNRRRGSDNGTSSIFDTLQDAGILSDDCWQIIRKYKVINELCSKDDARCEIEIMEIEE